MKTRKFRPLVSEGIQKAVRYAALLVGLLVLLGGDLSAQGHWYDNYNFSNTGILGYWPFDVDGRDVSGNGHHAMVHGAQMASDVNGQSYEFSTPSDYIDLNLHLDERQPFTVSFAVSPLGTGVQRMISTAVVSAVGGGGFDIHYNTNHNPPVHFRLYNDGINVVSADQQLLSGWQRIICVWDGTTAQIYLNGQLADTQTPTNSVVPSPETVKIGALGDLIARWEDFVGRIDDVFILNRALTPSEAAALSADTDNDGMPDFFHISPISAITGLINQVLALNLQRGITNSLDAKLDAAMSALEDVNQNNNVAAINSLSAFINAVSAQSGKLIAAADAARLIAAAQHIIAVLSQ